jgi:hypothetical protein
VDYTTRAIYTIKITSIRMTYINEIFPTRVTRIRNTPRKNRKLHKSCTKVILKIFAIPSESIKTSENQQKCNKFSGKNVKKCIRKKKYYRLLLKKVLMLKVYYKYIYYNRSKNGKYYIDKIIIIFTPGKKLYFCHQQPANIYKPCATSVQLSAT